MYSFVLSLGNKTLKQVIRNRLCLAIFLKTQPLLGSLETLFPHDMLIHESLIQIQINM